MSKSRRGSGGVYRPSYPDKDGNKVLSEFWWIRYRGLDPQDGKRKQFFENSHSTKKTAAEKLLNNRLSEMTTGNFVGPDAEKITFNEIADLYLKEWKADYRGKYLKNQERIVARLKEYFGKYRAVVAADKFVDYKLHRQAQNYADETIQKDRKTLLAIYASAVRAKKLNRGHCPEIKRQKGGVNNRRTEKFSEEQYMAVREKVNDDLRPVVDFAWLTGWRPSEILNLQWEVNVDQPEAGWVRLLPGTTKNKDERMLPYFTLPMLKTLIEGQRERAEKIAEVTKEKVTHVFHYGLDRPSHLVGKQIRDYRSFNEAMEAAGIENRIFYDFRRSARTNLRRAGINDRVAMALLGHRTLVMSNRYDAIDPKDLLNATGQLANFYGQEPIPPQPPKEEPAEQEPMEEEERAVAVGGGGKVLNFRGRR